MSAPASHARMISVAVPAPATQSRSCSFAYSMTLTSVCGETMIFAPARRACAASFALRVVPAAMTTPIGSNFSANRSMSPNASGVVSVTSRIRIPFSANTSATDSAAATLFSRTTPMICSIATFSNSSLRDMAGRISRVGDGCRVSAVGCWENRSPNLWSKPRQPRPDTRHASQVSYPLMVLINKAINEVTVKLVYYGPGLCGKTTNLEKIYGNPKLDNKGKMISMSTETDRTLFFDFMPMELGTIGGQKVRVQLYTVPGQVFYDATRKLVLRGADGVVFVADSQSSMHESNLDSLENLKANLRLNRIDPDKVALVFQYNKRDLPNVDTVEDMNAYLRPDHHPVVEAAAIQGVGVTATLRAAVGVILENLKKNVDV